MAPHRVTPSEYKLASSLRYHRCQCDEYSQQEVDQGQIEKVNVCWLLEQSRLEAIAYEHEQVPQETDDEEDSLRCGYISSGILQLWVNVPDEWGGGVLADRTESARPVGAEACSITVVNV